MNQLAENFLGVAPCASNHEPCDFALLSAFPDKSGVVGVQTVWQCRRCGHGVTRPALADVSFLYDNRASQDFQPLATGLARTIKSVAFDRQVRALLAQLPERPRKVLDFGCGSGLFTSALSDRLGPGSVTGSDFHAEPPADLAGRPYFPMAAVQERAGEFDLVIAMHVLEHDDDALGLLARIAAMARPGGLVALEVPNIDCVWARPLGRAWDAWYLPFHRSHFSRSSLTALAERGGLEVIAQHDICVPSMGRSLANLCGARNSLPFLLAGVALHPIQWVGEKLSRRPSALRLIARKR